MKQTIKQLQKEGYLVEMTKSQHYRITAPDGQFFFAASSPSCVFAHKNLLSLIKRSQKK